MPDPHGLLVLLAILLGLLALGWLARKLDVEGARVEKARAKAVRERAAIESPVIFVGGLLWWSPPGRPFMPHSTGYWPLAELRIGHDGLEIGPGFPLLGHLPLFGVPTWRLSFDEVDRVERTHTGLKFFLTTEPDPMTFWTGSKDQILRLLASHGIRIGPKPPAREVS